GDSITLGVGDDASRPEEDRGYTPRLQNRLRDNGQPEAVVLNRGVGSERTPEGLLRIDQVLAQEGGDVLLLMEGTNDISREISRETTMFDLAEMARRAENRGYQVVHATLIARIPRANVDSDNILNQNLNQELRDLAGRSGRRLVDNFYVFGAIPDAFATHYWSEPTDHVGHPNALGYDEMAGAFLDVLTGDDAVPPVPGPMSPEHGARQVPPSGALRIDLWDFGAGIDLANTALTINDTEVAADISGTGNRGQIFYTPATPLRGVVRVGLRTRDLATPANAFDGEIASFVIAGTTFLDGDLDRSGRVDGADLVAFGRAFGALEGSGRYERAADFDRDGDIDGEDLAVLAANFGRSSF
ncbi:MAG: GDSL-type esterase/lipase family protein, partial [Chloroflexi bacterium]|nr:GDSL-type esterase/lipase family protein [Chloroflexota bacterium]